MVLYLALQTWAVGFRSGLLVLGDNLASLSGVLNLRGKGGALNAITKENRMEARAVLLALRVRPPTHRA